jgi:hypothetical protein
MNNAGALEQMIECVAIEEVSVHPDLRLLSNRRDNHQAYTQ